MWEIAGEGHFRLERTKGMQLEEGSCQCKRDGQVLWNTGQYHMALTATPVGRLWGLVLRPSLPLQHASPSTPEDPDRLRKKMVSKHQQCKASCWTKVTVNRQCTCLPYLFLCSQFVPYTWTQYCRAETWVILLPFQHPHIQWVTKFWLHSQIPN